MPKYVFQWDYKSAALEFKKGQVIELDKEEAEWINNDSPGVLKLQSSKDRQVKAAKKIERE